MYFIETTEWIQLIFGKEATLGLSCIVLEGNSGISENKGSPNSSLINLAMARQL